ncbi:uncharacterized protein LOC62_02G002562 [Vanrija pseudolonga]|uniref:Zn(2)-C6 fungal-type domain-containing protein n=1 Tax=Vanrija pseudolonga TaxID=143232 RepID=A0AAF0Y2J4_9TREE|nr:hypothetical protein LOC62_02G002562 [Vanrija pseudolonga]
MSHPHGLYPEQQGRGPIPDNRGRKSIKCLNCQARRAKCSSDRPACIQCLNRGEVCYYNGEAAVETDQLRNLRSRVAVLSDKDKAKYQKRKAKVATEESEEDGPSIRKVRSTPTLGHERSHSLVPPVPPLPYFTRSMSKSPIPVMEPMTPVMMPSVFETPHNGRSPSDFLHPTEAYGSVPPTPSNFGVSTTSAIQAPVPRRASTAPQAFSFVNYTEEDADELMEAVAPSGGRGSSSPQKNTPQTSRQRKPPTLVSSDDEFEPAPTPKPRARQQSIPARKSSLKTVKSMGNLPRPPSALLLPIATDLVPRAMSPAQTPVSAMVASTTAAPFVEHASRTVRRYASANFSPSLSTVPDVPDQLIDPQLRIGPMPDFHPTAQPYKWGDVPHSAAPGYFSAAPPPVASQAYTFTRPGSPSLYVRIPQPSTDVSTTIRPGAAGGNSPHGGFPPLPPLPTATLWAGALPSPNPSLPSPVTQTVRLSDAVKLDVANDPYLLVTTPVRSPSPAFSSGSRQSNRKASDPLLDELLNWHPSPPPTAASAINSAPPTPYLSVPGMSGYFMWVPEPGQPTGVLPLPGAVSESGVPQDGLVVQE